MNRIDLTKNKLFTQLKSTKTGIIYIGRNRNKNVVGSLPTGTKREMASKRLIMEYYNGSHCERCGDNLESLHKKSEVFGLCRKCNNYMDKNRQLKELFKDYEHNNYDDSRKLRVLKVGNEKGKLVEGWKSNLNGRRRVVNNQPIEEIQRLINIL